MILKNSQTNDSKQSRTTKTIKTFADIRAEQALHQEIDDDFDAFHNSS